MKIAIPTFATRVSPRFDCAQSVLVVTVDEGGVPERQELTASHWAPHERINRLVELGIDTVICGGIDRWSAASLQSAGVTIYGWVAGEVDDALAALLQGDLDAEAATQRAGRCRCRRFPAEDDAQSWSPGSGAGNPGHGWRGGRSRGRRGGTGPGHSRNR